MLESRTLTEPLTLTGSSYWPGNQNSISLQGSDEPGIRINGVPVSPTSLRAVSSMGARFLVLVDKDGRSVANVVEHLISAIRGAGVESVDIQSPKWVPVFGPGIDGVYSKILTKSQTVEKTLEPCRIGEERVIRSNDGSCTLIVSPCDTLSLEIERKDDAEIGVDSSIVFEDLYAVLRASRDARIARPIARVRHPLVNGFQKSVELLGGKGVSEENYIFNRPNFSPEDVRGQMLAAFNGEGNEHLVHTGIADFFGELHTYFPRGIRGKLKFTGKNNHHTRLELLNKLLLQYLYG